jgi:hypothetical protein
MIATFGTGIEIFLLLYDPCVSALHSRVGFVRYVFPYFSILVLCPLNFCLRALVSNILVTNLFMFTCSSASFGFRSSCRVPRSNKHQLSCSVCVLLCFFTIQIKNSHNISETGRPFLSR